MNFCLNKYFERYIIVQNICYTKSNWIIQNNTFYGVKCKKMLRKIFIKTFKLLGKVYRYDCLFSRLKDDRWKISTADNNNIENYFKY